MPLKRISDLPAGTPPYSGASLLEVSVPTGATPPYASRKVAISDFVAPLYGDVGRNLVHNPLYAVQQRGIGSFTTNGGYTADRWASIFVGAGVTQSVSIVAVSDADRAAIGDEAAASAIQSVVVGGAAVNNFTYLYQPIENLRRLSGKTVTVSFWAKASVASRKVGVSIDEVFGTGGSPSAAVAGIGQSVTIGTAYARYSVTLSMPSTSGKVYGTNGDDHVNVQLWFTADATNNAGSGSVGVQSATFTLWGVQLEIGSTATPLEKPDPQQDLAKCQRFYQLGYILWGGQFVLGSNYLASSSLTAMRAVPTVAILNDTTAGGFGARSLSFATSATGSLGGTGGVVFVNVAPSATGAGILNLSFTASADL